MSSTATIKARPEELSIYAERHFHFMNLWTVYRDLLSGKYAPSLNEKEYPVGITMMFVLYGYFYSLVEDSDEGLNGFRIWRERLPQEEAAIASRQESDHFSATLEYFEIGWVFMGADRALTSQQHLACSIIIPEQRFTKRWRNTKRWRRRYSEWIWHYTQTTPKQ